MNPMEIRWKKQVPDKVRFYSNGQHPISKSKNRKKKSTKKKVQFNCRMSNGKGQAFENRKYNASRTVQSDKTTVDDQDFNSSINILPNE